LAASADLTAELTIHDDQLVLDAYAPIRFDGSLGANNRTRFSADVPLLVSFSDALKPAPAPSDGLWDADYYRRFWTSYPITRAGRSGAPLIDSRRIVAGPISVRQILVPPESLRVAVGLSDRLAVHLPLSGRALFGTAQGFFDAGVQWRGPQAALSGRFNLALRNLQAAAVGLDSEHGHVPVVEDELDADIAVRSDDLLLDRHSIDLLAAYTTPAGLDRLSLSLALRKSARSRSIPGVFQLSTGTRLNTLNELLNTLGRDLQLMVPPRTMLYRNLDINFLVDKGTVVTERPWLKLEGLQIFSSPNLALESNIRLYGGRNGDTLHLRDWLDFFRD
jgi:hypothetical protein